MIPRNYFRAYLGAHLRSSSSVSSGGRALFHVFLAIQSFRFASLFRILWLAVRLMLQLLLDMRANLKTSADQVTSPRVSKGRVSLGIQSSRCVPVRCDPAAIGDCLFHGIRVQDPDQSLERRVGELVNLYILAINHSSHQLDGEYLKELHAFEWAVGMLSLECVAECSHGYNELEIVDAPGPSHC